jgi:hypothetical protein
MKYHQLDLIGIASLTDLNVFLGEANLEMKVVTVYP